jgi:hypothetical protein
MTVFFTAELASPLWANRFICATSRRLDDSQASVLEACARARLCLWLMP